MVTTPTHRKVRDVWGTRHRRSTLEYPAEGHCETFIADAERSKLTKLRERETWVGDVRQRQRNVVFPDTVQNEGRFWRNLVSRRLNFWQWTGFALLFLFVFGTFGFIVLKSFRMAPHQPGSWWHTAMIPLGYWLEAALLMVLIFGPIFLLVIWGTRRSLRHTVMRESKTHNQK